MDSLQDDLAEGGGGVVMCGAPLAPRAKPQAAERENMEVD